MDPSTEMSTLFVIIPARGGSKGIPRKNLTKLLGKTLIEYSLEAAAYVRDTLHSDTRIILSSDSHEILEYANTVSADACLRPKELALDHSLTIDAIIHALESIKTGSSEEGHVMLLQPTVPFRPEWELKDVLLTYWESITKDFNSLVSLAKIEAHHPFRLKRVLDSGECISYIDLGFEDMRPRQSLPDCYIRSGSYYMSPLSRLVDCHSVLSSPTRAYIHKNVCPVNIDTLEDMIIAEYQLSFNK